MSVDVNDMNCIHSSDKEAAKETINNPIGTPIKIPNISPKNTLRNESQICP